MGSKVLPRRLGRWPSLVAAECQVDEALSDYIAEQEAKYLERNPWAASPAEPETETQKGMPSSG
jgi:hypothetical protein